MAEAVTLDAVTRATSTRWCSSATVPIDFRFLAKRRLADYPLIGTVIRKAGHITIEKATLTEQLSGADVLAQLLRDRRQIVVFPEGTFLRPPGILLPDYPDRAARNTHGVS